MLHLYIILLVACSSHHNKITGLVCVNLQNVYTLIKPGDVMNGRCLV